MKANPIYIKQNKNRKKSSSLKSYIQNKYTTTHRNSPACKIIGVDIF